MFVATPKKRFTEAAEDSVLLQSDPGQGRNRLRPASERFGLGRLPVDGSTDCSAMVFRWRRCVATNVKIPGQDRGHFGGRAAVFDDESLSRSYESR